jgi:hypothetical protein
MFTNLDTFKKLYGELLAAVQDWPGDICVFFPQTGKNYYGTDTKLLFIGQSANTAGESRDVEELFDLNDKDRIVNRDDEIEWVEKAANPSSDYNTNRSQFWRLIKKVSKGFYGKEDWYNYIAWSNVCKVKPCTKNPPWKLLQMQRAAGLKILTEEIRVLKPDFVIFLSSQWENFYLESIGLDREKACVKPWADTESRYQTINGVTYIMSPHPRGNKEAPHVEAILEILKEKK